jgi:transcription elongation factor GreA
MANNHELSQAAHDRLVAELEELRTHGRIEMADRIERAREHGDLKENAEYHAAKEEKAKMEARVAQVTEILANCTIVESGSSDTVTSGSVVVMRYDDEDDDEAERYLIGSIEERHDDLHVISPKSALGEKLLGAKVGDAVTYETRPPGAPPSSPATGELSVVILAIE